MINWFNSNQGFVMIILTFAYVVATIIIVVYSRKSIKEMKITRENELRPYIFGQFAKFSDYVNIVEFQVKNSGKTGGIIKKFTVSPELKMAKDSDGLRSLDDFILAPNQTFNILLQEMMGDMMDDKYTIHIEYQAIGSDKVYIDDYEIPFIAYSLVGHTYTKQGNSNKEEDALRNIASILASINKRI